MKTKFSIVLILLTGFLFSQEFGTKFLTIDESSLPQVFTLDNSYFVQKHTASNFPRSMGITTNNYWQPVSMIDALNRQDAYLNRRNTSENKITAESLGFRRVVEKESGIRIEVNDPNYERRSRVRNTVYRDASMPFYYSPYYYRPARISDF